MLQPKTSQYYLHLYDAQTSTIVHTFPLPQLELVTSVECVSLEISEVTHKRKLLIAAGTISQKGEAYAARGGVYVLDVIDVVSEPDQPQTGKKMSLLSREETKGGITSLMGMAGLLGTAQGMFLPMCSRYVRLTCCLRPEDNVQRPQRGRSMPTCSIPGCAMLPLIAEEFGQQQSVAGRRRVEGSLVRRLQRMFFGSV